MEVEVQRTTDSQKIQPNGPRVSFNRDVHVKRFGKRSSSDTLGYPSQATNAIPLQYYQLRREHPKDLSEDRILKEAALVLSQAERIKCTADGDKSKSRRQKSPTSNQFNSLPSRKKSVKPITRSVSDASSKKTKKPSIFNIFSRKSDPHLDQIEQDRRFKEGGGRRLIRSKSDASSSRNSKSVEKKHTSGEHGETVLSSALKPTQLSPIIENTQREDYFEGVAEDSSKNDKTKETEGATYKEEEKPNYECTTSENAEKISKTVTREKPLTVTGNIGYTNNADLDLVPSKPVSDTVRETITSLATHSKSIEDMHSSQLPPEKLPLTKGLTVDGMVKRLSMERFSPPPPISGPAFSYTRPNEQIIYAQVVCDADEKLEEECSPFSREKNMNLPYSKYQTNGFGYQSYDGKNKYITSQNQNKSKIYASDNNDSRYEPYSPTHGITKEHDFHTPQNWKHSPKNLSDEDEGLGFEPRKYYEEDFPSTSPHGKRYLRSEKYDRKSPSYEPPIIPVIRSVSPIEVAIDGELKLHTDLRKVHETPSRNKCHSNEFNSLSHRRKALESKILSRRFGPVDHFTENKVDLKYRYSPERSREFKKEFKSDDYRNELQDRWLTPERETKYHKPDKREILSRYSPDRTHLDMISPSRDLKSSRYVITKYYDDGEGVVKEINKRETHVDEYGIPHTRESRRRERLDSPRPYDDSDPSYRNGHGHIEENYKQDYEPKSLDSQITEINHLSSENVKKIDMSRNRHEEHWTSSLNRDKRQQRSFDKGDSGIENDFRKESFSGDLTTKWKKRTVYDDIKACEIFIKKEKRHSEEQHSQYRKYDFIYRERSIDDGSHFDPRLDKYPKGTLRKKESNSSPTTSQSSPIREPTKTATIAKREKRVGGLEKVKKLFSSGRKKDNKHQTTAPTKDQSGKDHHYMVKEEEMRLRYNEYRGVAPNLHHEPNVPDISTRRRLSTPKASPLLKRTSSEKTPKTGSLTLRNGSQTKAEKSGWFKSLDRKAHKKYNEKNLRFFGDTDQESSPSASISKTLSKARNRPSITSLNRNQKYSLSAYHLDRIPEPNENRTPRSNSLQNIENGFDEVDRPKRKHHSRSRELHNISESASDEDDNKSSRHSSTPQFSRKEKGSSHVVNQNNRHHHRHEHNTNHHRSADEKESRTPQRESSDTTRIEFRKPPPGPPKPARSAERTHSYSRERDRLHDSSGTEGESSLPSQRSVVYLHATTVGAIPQPYQLTASRRAISREELRSKNKNQQQQQEQPMTRTVSRSVSMLAPWKPKFLHEGYEINYSQEAPAKYNKTGTIPRKSSSILTSKSKKTDTLPRSRRDNPPSSVRTSIITNTSKSGDSASNQRTFDKKSSDFRKDTLNKRRVT